MNWKKYPENKPNTSKGAWLLKLKQSVGSSVIPYNVVAIFNEALWDVLKVTHYVEIDEVPIC